MKKLLSLLVLMSFIACTSEDETLEKKSQNKAIQNVSAIRSFDEALQIAQNSISMLDGKETTRAAKPRTIDMKANKVVKAKGTRATADKDTLMYVFNFEDNQGFTIVAAPQNVEPLIAVTEKGSYDPDVPSDIDGFNDFMENAKKYVGNRFGPGPDLPVLQGYEIKEWQYFQKGPFVTANWGEFHPEGEFCPNGIAGCMNTAIAQLMSYYETPTSVDLTYPNADISTQTLNWTQMKAHQTGHSVGGCTTTDIHQSIGRLLRQIGYITQSNYYDNQTTTFFINFPSGFLDLGYTSSGFSSYDTVQVVNQINAHHPVVMSGGGGAWLSDGYKLTKTIVKYYERVAANINEYVLVSTTEYDHYYYHLNWGWYGDCNGYFAKNIFDSQAATWYDGTSNNTHNFGTNIIVMTMYPIP